MVNVIQLTNTGKNEKAGQRLIAAMVVTLGAALLLLSVACGSAEPASTEDSGGSTASRESAPPPPPPPQLMPAEQRPPAAAAEPAAPAAQSQPAAPVIVPQPQSERRVIESQPLQDAPAAAPSAQSGQPSQSSQGDTSGAAPRTVPRRVPRDTATSGPQPLVSSSLDPISTFSLDTDRASFQRALQETQDGYQIDPADVRAEEWINSLNYGYPRPSRPDEFAVHSEVFQHPDTPGMHLARVGIQAPDAQKRRPVNVTLLLDTSGSMSDGNRLDIAERAARTIVDNLRDSDRVAVVKFDDQVVFSQSHISPRSAMRVRDLTDMWAGGATNVQAGLDEALWLAHGARGDNPNAVNYVILFSDGVANVNATDPFAILHNVGEDSEYSRVNPIRIVTIGVGIDGNDHLLEQIAQFGNGWYRYFETPQQAEATFSLANWDRITNPFADQARAQIIWNPEMVSHWRIVGYENRVTPDATFTQNRREFAEIPAGTATTVFYEVQLTSQVASRNAATARLGDIEIRWVEPVTGVSREQYDVVAGAWREEFSQLRDPMLRLGAITGLSADIFASLDDGGYGTGGSEAPQRLTVLLEEYGYLQSQLGHVQAYQDVGAMLENLELSAGGYWEQPRPVREGPGTGYSP